MFDSTDSAVNDIIKNCEPNNDDIFVVSSYPRTGDYKISLRAIYLVLSYNDNIILL